ncbi:hypothetical protein FP435_03410 [Lactobacillus sp. PV037]|uniref:hypothetical protein n=1 Tax=unclassified Lactobacillus TaxID=2620435 RepID=UPI00223EC168|nr:MULTISPECIES: hypothetical protein [unclassified Lactobacillus]QNQ82332.1 hypothetical protein FP433_04420 [Lactobacillus sp. PV012]QNQ83556.1 hypothetical protein FP435_03410 [Lactobacillus sp. PV037]
MANVNNFNNKFSKAKLLNIFTTPKGENIIAYKVPRGDSGFQQTFQELKRQELFLQTAQKQAADFERTWITLFVQTPGTNYLATTYQKGQLVAKLFDMFEALVVSADQIDRFYFPLDFANRSLDYLEGLMKSFKPTKEFNPEKWITFEDAPKKVIALNKFIREEEKDPLTYKRSDGIEGVLAATQFPLIAELDFKIFGGSHLLQDESAQNFAQLFFDYLLTLLELYPETQKDVFTCVPLIREAIVEKYDHSNHDDLPF